MSALRKAFEIRAEWDGEARVIAPEIAAENGLAAPGDEIELAVARWQAA